MAFIATAIRRQSVGKPVSAPSPLAAGKARKYSPRAIWEWNWSQEETVQIHVSRPQLIGRIAAVVGLTAALAGCIDVTAEVDVLSETEGKGRSVITIGTDIYPMLKSMAGSEGSPLDDFCDEEGAVFTENDDGSATCTVELTGELSELNEDGVNENASFKVVEPGVVRAAFSTAGMSQQVAEQGQGGAESTNMLLPYFDGHFATIIIRGKLITDTNMELNPAKTEAKAQIPFTKLLNGTAQLPDEYFAIVDTN